MNILRKITLTLAGVSKHPLYRGRPATAAASFVYAQCRARLHRGPIRVDFPNDTVLEVSPWAKGAAHFIFPRLCEFEQMSFVMHYLRPGELFVDAGANIGAYTVLAAGVAGADVLAFEPSPRTFKQLQRNVEINHIAQRVRVIHAALGSGPGTLKLTDDLGTENYVVRGSDNGVDVPVAALDDQLGQRTARLMKVDVEGFETEVFAGARRLLEADDTMSMIVERNNSGERYGFDEDQLHESIRQAGFSPFAYDPFRRELTHLGPDQLGNLIYLRDFASARQRLVAAPPFKIAGVAV